MENQPLTLEFLKSLRQSGHVIIDCNLVMREPGQYRITYFSDKKESFSSVVECTHDQICVFYNEVVEACGYGPKGLTDIIYRNARDKSNKDGIHPSKIIITLSPECAGKIEDHHFRSWKSYGFTVCVNPNLTGTQFAYSIAADPL
jgi:hypothetical protein